MILNFEWTTGSALRQKRVLLNLIVGCGILAFFELSFGFMMQKAMLDVTTPFLFMISHILCSVAGPQCQALLCGWLPQHLPTSYIMDMFDSCLSLTSTRPLPVHIAPRYHFVIKSPTSLLDLFVHICNPCSPWYCTWTLNLPLHLHPFRCSPPKSHIVVWPYYVGSWWAVIPQEGNISWRSYFGFWAKSILVIEKLIPANLCLGGAKFWT
jgi:hypothetical protein